MTYEEIKEKYGFGKQKRKPRQEETQLQTACVSWFRMQYPDYIIFSVPNGSSRNPIEGANLKKAGALAGVSDLVILADKGRTLFIEMKVKKRKQSLNQKRFEVYVNRLGFTYCVARSVKDFIKCVKTWLSNE